MMKRWSYYIIFFCTLTAQVSFAQSSVNCAGKKYHIPKFKADSAFSYTNRFVKYKILPSIKESKYDLEIRYNFYGGFGWLPGEGHCIVIRGNRDSLFAVDYFLKMDEKSRQSRSQSINVRNLSQKDTLPRPQLHIRKLTPAKPLADLVQTLIDNRIMDLQDNDAFLKVLKQKNIQIKDANITDCCTSAYYEIKINNKFRNFTTNYYYQAENQDIKEFQYQLNIDKVFGLLVPNFFK